MVQVEALVVVVEVQDLPVAKEVRTTRREVCSKKEITLNPNSNNLTLTLKIKLAVFVGDTIKISMKSHQTFTTGKSAHYLPSAGNVAK